MSADLKSSGRLERVLQAGHFVVTAETSPPVATDLALALDRARPLKNVADAVNVTDGAGAKAHLSSLVVAGALVRDGIEPILQMTNRDRAEAHVNTANLYRKLNRNDLSERSFLDAIRVNPQFVPAYVNLADLYRIQQREAEGEKLLREALDLVPGQSGLHHALGLLLVREALARAD